MFNFMVLNITIRILVDTNKKLWFVAKDVCDALGYKHSADAINKHCRKDMIKRHPIETPGGVQEMQIIGEGNIYRLICRSKLKNELVVEFEHKVFDEILPSIRKHGIYISDPAIARIQKNPDLIRKLIDDKVELEKLKQTMRRRTRYMLKKGPCFRFH